MPLRHAHTPRRRQFGLTTLVCGLALVLPALDGRAALPWADVAFAAAVQFGAELFTGAVGLRVIEQLHGIPVRLQWRSPGFVRLACLFSLLLMFVVMTLVDASVAALVRSTYSV